MPESPRVLLPGDSAQGLCQLMTTVLWRHTHLYIRQNNNNNNNSSSSSSSNSVAILAQDCQRTNREVYSSFDGLFFWEAPRSASASGGVHLTRAHSDPIASACGDPVLVVVSVLCNDKFWYRQCRKLWNCRRCSSCGVVDVTVIIQLVPAVHSHVSRAIQYDGVLDIPVMPQCSS